MSYAETLPDSVLKVFRWFNIACLCFAVLLLIDIKVLPGLVYQEKILERQEQYVTIRSRHNNNPRKTQMDNVILVTENFRYTYHRVQNFDPRKADSVRLVTTPVLGIVKTGYQKSHGEEKELKQVAGMFGTFVFIPIAFGLIALFGVCMRNNKEQLLNAAVMNGVLIIVQLWLMGYLGTFNG